MIFFFRLMPALSALLLGGAFYWQLRNPLFFPWIALCGVLWVLACVFLMARKRVRFTDLMEKMLPTALFLFSLVYGMLLAEGWTAKVAIVLLGAVASFLSLELLFLLAFMPSRYPVNSLSHVNLAYVPFVIWYTVATSVGLMAFLHSPKWVYVVALMILSVALFRTTGHPGATKEQNSLWMLVGGLAGLHIGLLSAALPLSMSVQGTLAMVVFCGILRMRRYLYHPIPSRRQAWIEASLGIVLVGIVMGTSRWL